jgi:hypothetical protein
MDVFQGGFVDRHSRFSRLAGGLLQGRPCSAAIVEFQKDLNRFRWS